MNYHNFFIFLLTKLKSINLGIIFLLTLITSISIITLYSAANGSFNPWVSKQIIRFFLGLILLIGMAMTDIRRFFNNAYLFYVIIFLLLVAVEIKGYVGMGAQRWVDLYLFNLQPSELMKIGIVLGLARYYHALSYEETGKIEYLIIPFLLITAPVLLVLKQPDLGTATIIFMTAAFILYLACVRIWVFLTGATIAGVTFPFLWAHLYDYQKKRLLTFLNPDQDLAQSGYHILQSKIAIGSAGLLGKGYRQGSQARLSFLPEKQTDFIFTMFTEEWGLIGGYILILLYITLISYGFIVAHKARNHFCRLLCMGLTSVLFLHVFINIGMVCEMLPVVGVPLPLMSYGGTSLLTVMISFGLILSASIHTDTRINANSF